jgi:hypothetical protein
MIDWSEQAPHIRSLYRPWRPGDGYGLEEIEAVEAQLEIRLPEPLRSFYQHCGHRDDLTQRAQWLWAPEQWLLHEDYAIFCIENQACAFWALQLPILDPAAPLSSSPRPDQRNQSMRSRPRWSGDPVIRTSRRFLTT